MQVTITFNKLPVVTMSFEDWEKIGKEKGYCKSRKILMSEINQIEYTPNN